MKETQLYKYILNKINSGNQVALLIVANASKASPGRTGFKMAIASDESTFGTVGGGIMEYNIISEVLESFQNDLKLNYIKKLHHSNLASGDKSGLICGGVQTVIFKSLDKEHINVIEQIIQNLEANNKGVFSISEEVFSFQDGQENPNDILLSVSENKEWLFSENLGTPNTVYIIGGGHVGLAVSRIMRALDFRVIVFDHRESVQTMGENSFAHEKITTNYKDIWKYIKEGIKSYVVVVTPSHDGDKDALKAVLNLDLKYIGSMGSAKKIISIFNQLRADGFTEQDLSKIKTPIGLEIEAESPEEIAVSIAAEIIKIKNSKY